MKLKRKYIKIEITELELDLIIGSLEASNYSTEQIIYGELANDLKEFKNQLCQ